VNATTGPLLRAQIGWALRRLQAKPIAVVACMLDDVLKGWGPEVVKVFYGTDDFAAGADLVRMSRRTLLRRERRQLANADLVVAISQVLAERWSEMGSRVALIPNGVPQAAYDKPTIAPTAADVSLPPPVAGVIGHLSARIDIALLEAVVDAGCSLLLIGPVDPTWEPERFSSLVHRQRVAWLGRRTFEQLPAYLRSIDVGLTPYSDTPFNRASFPLKTLEYLAAGLPAVSTDLPATRWLNSDLIRIASQPADFARAVCQAVAEGKSETVMRKRREFAARHSWQHRAEDFAQAIGLIDAVQNAKVA
jgi:teichuronic acid biosynthesis glycosyltransferase TuaH